MNTDLQDDEELEAATGKQEKIGEACCYSLIPI